MTNKMKLLIGLLILGLVIIGGGTWFLLNPMQQIDLNEGLEITVIPAPGNYLTNSQNVSSEALLKDVQVYRSISDKRYSIYPSWYPDHTVNKGEFILVVSGRVQNQHQENKEIAMYAEGFDESGHLAAWTLDAAHIMGQIGMHLENGETGEFTLHLNFSEKTKSIRIYGSNYPFTPP